MGTTKNVDMSSKEVKIKIVADPKKNDDDQALNQGEPGVIQEEDQAKKSAKTNKPKVQRVRGKKYMATKSKVDRTRQYDVLSAIELVKKLSYSKFEGTINADIEVRSTDVSVEVTLPHSTGQQRKVVVADDQVLKEIEAGKIDFDILVSSPEFMPKLAKLARLLGPKGLMPNPKNGTLTANPDRAVKELAAGKQVLKSEKKQPLIHLSLGKTSMETKKLIENLRALLNALKGKAVNVVLSPTMGPGVKVDIESVI
ncbi:MAG: 50S ribosomal protein L1 [Candidatus Paceibacterota bacterium]